MKIIIDVNTQIDDLTRCTGTWKFKYDGMLFGNAVDVPNEYVNDLVIMRLLVENLLESIEGIEKEEKSGAYKDVPRTYETFPSEPE